MELDPDDNTRVSFVVYANDSAEWAVPSYPDVYGDFSTIPSDMIPLIKYAHLISEALRGKFLHRSVKYLKG